MRLIHLDQLINYSYSFRKQPLVSLKIKTVASLIRETWAVIATSLLKKNLTYSPIFKAYFKKILAAAKACLVFIKNRCRSQMSFKIGVLIKLSQYSEKNTCAGVSFEWSCRPSREYCEMFKNSYFYGTTSVAASADLLFYIIFSKRHCCILNIL